MKGNGVSVAIQEKGTGKNKDAMIFSPVIFSSQEEAEKFTVAIIGEIEKKEEKK